MADTKIRITSEVAGDGFEKADAGLKKLEQGTERLNALTAKATEATEEHAKAQEHELKVALLALEIAEREAIIGGDDAKLQSVRQQRQELTLTVQLAQKFNLTLEEAIPIAQQLAGLDRQANAAVAARVAARDLEVAEMRAQALLNAELVAAEGVRLAEERRITLEKEKQAALQVSMVRRAAGQVAGAVGLGGVAAAGAGGVAGVAAFVALELVLRGVSALMEAIGGKSEETGKNMGEAAVKTDEFAAASKRTKDALGELQERFKGAAEQAERLRRAEDALSGAKLGADLAGVDLAEASGKLTPEEANAKRGKLRVGAASAKLDREAESERAKVRDAAGAVGEFEGKQTREQIEENAARAELAASLRQQAAATEANDKAALDLRAEQVREEGASFETMRRAQQAAESKATADETAAAMQKKVNDINAAQAVTAEKLRAAQEQLAATTETYNQEIKRIALEKLRMTREDEVAGKKASSAQVEKITKDIQEKDANDAKLSGELQKFKEDQATARGEALDKHMADLGREFKEGEKGAGKETKYPRSPINARPPRRQRGDRTKPGAPNVTPASNFDEFFHSADAAASSSGDLNSAAEKLNTAAAEMASSAGTFIAAAETIGSLAERIAALETTSINA